MSHQSLATHTNELSPGRSLPSERKTLTEHLKSIKLAVNHFTHRSRLIAVELVD
jgi:hypothetical protein